MSVVLSNYTNDVFTGGGSTFTLGASLTVPASSFVLVAVAENSNSTELTGCTVGGVSGTVVGSFPAYSGSYACSTLYKFGVGAVSAGSQSVVITNNGGGAAQQATAMAFTGVNSATPLGTAAVAGFLASTTPSTGVITGVDSTGLFLLGFAQRYNNALTAEGAGATQLVHQGYSSNITGHVATAPGAASFTYTPTVPASPTSIWGVYVNAAAITKLISVGSQLVGINGQALHT